MLYNQYGQLLRRNPAFTPSGPVTLQSIIPSTCCHIDATIAASYPGSGQTWSNLVAAPADGSSQATYNFYLGNTSSSAADDPTFNGSAGSPSAYFSLDGGDYFRGVAASAATAGIFNTMHKTTGGTDSWVALVFRNPVTISGVTYYFVTASSAASTTGIEYFVTSTGGGRLYTRQQVGFTTVPASDFRTGVVTSSTEMLLIISRSNSSNNWRIWNKSRTVANTGGTFTSTSANATYFAPYLFGGTPSNSGNFPSGTRVYAFAAGNAYLDDTAAGLIFDYFNAAHGRTYA